jgi:hypothetical protein
MNYMVRAGTQGAGRGRAVRRCRAAGRDGARGGARGRAGAQAAACAVGAHGARLLLWGTQGWVSTAGWGSRARANLRSMHSSGRRHSEHAGAACATAPVSAGCPARRGARVSGEDVQAGRPMRLWLHGWRGSCRRSARQTPGRLNSLLRLSGAARAARGSRQGTLITLARRRSSSCRAGERRPARRPRSRASSCRARPRPRRRGPVFRAIACACMAACAAPCADTVHSVCACMAACAAPCADTVHSVRKAGASLAARLAAHQAGSAGGACQRLVLVLRRLSCGALRRPHRGGADEPGLRQAGGYAAFGRGAKGRGRADVRGADDSEAVASPKRAKLGAPRSAVQGSARALPSLRCSCQCAIPQAAPSAERLVLVC